MRNTDASRIAWFLGLQRILRFPRYFMAPSARLRLSRGIAASNPDISADAPRSFQSRAASFVRLSHSAPQTLSLHRPTTSSSGRAHTTTVSRHATDAVPQSPATRSPRLAYRDLASVTVANPRLQRSVGARPAAGQQVPGAWQKYRPIVDPGNDAVRTQKSPALAPSHPRSIQQSAREMEINTASRATAPEINFSSRNKNFIAAGETVLSKRSIGSQTNSWSIDREDGEQNVQTPRNRSSVSTIHLDGSALGRWTVQYLERALGKPATGMTGVDPRATPPRSRVAPF
jgi:hypothetical protein